MGYSIQKAAERVHLSADTLRYYEKEGLMPVIERDSHGNRIFNDQDLEWVKLIRCLRSAGMPIAMIKNYVALSLQGEATLESRRQIMLEQQRQIEAKIAEFQGYLAVIGKKVAYYNKLLNDEAVNSKLLTNLNCSVTPKESQI